MSEVVVSGTVEDVFTGDFVSVRMDDRVSKALPHFEEEGLSALVVLDDEGEYKGLLTRRVVARSRVNHALTKVGSLTRSAPKIEPHDGLITAAKLMLESGVRQLPVFRGEELAGIVSDEDVTHGGVLEEWGDSRVEEIMTRSPSFIQEDASIGAVISLFRDEDISHLPVVWEGELVGIVSVQDVIESVYRPRQHQTRGELVGETVPVLSAPVKHIMSKPVITVLPTDTLKRAEEQMQRFEISSLVVVEEGRPIGIVTKRDFLEPLAQMERVGRRLTVQFSIKDDVDVDEIQRGFLIDDFDSFARRYAEALIAGTLFVYMKAHGTNHEGRQLIHCRLQLRSRKGSFFASSEGWSVEAAFSVALERLERKVLRSTEMEHDPEYARKYLRRIRFPQTEF